MNNPDINNRLYHYTSLETFLNYILPSKQLKLSKIKNSRDPYEYKAFKYITTVHDPLGNDSDFETFLESARDLKLNSQYLCFTLPQSIKKENGSYFTRWGYDRPQLWELYGDNHRGVCIAFDKKKLISLFIDNHQDYDISQLSHRALTYKDIASRTDELKPRTLKDYFIENKEFNKEQFLKEFKDSFFFQKDVDYKDETEYRFLLVTDKEQDDMKISVEDSLIEIYFGDLVENEIIDFYSKIIMKEFQKIKLSQINWFNGSVIKRITKR